VLKRYEYPDGKVEQLFDDGTREVHYRNGSSQVYRADGSVLLYFGNGDVKRQWPGGRVDYYYAEVSAYAAMLVNQEYQHALYTSAALYSLHVAYAYCCC
jgi:hypothetical protein